jgi:DNA-binding transcriptional regulator YdaS (Cro superfamily)
MSNAASIAKMKETALEKAKENVGGSTALSRALSGKITPQAISQWKTVPANRVLDVERVTGVSRHRLRPDLYPMEREGAA